MWLEKTHLKAYLFNTMMPVLKIIFTTCVATATSLPGTIVHARVDVMKELREANLLTKDVVRDHHLLYLICRLEVAGTNLRFQCISD